MTLEDYAQGKGSAESFCYRLEFNNNLGLITGGSARKWGVYWMKSEERWWFDETMYTSPKDALSRIKTILLELIETAETGNFDLRDLPAFRGFETQAMMIFLYYEIDLHNREPISGRRISKK